ncbi:CBS domain-containing protein [Shewanella sp.]|uniref:CBS domain-containing protein n=2 Tax=Shewanella sp. TaxID=50422 RepID=UPI0040543DFE
MNHSTVVPPSVNKYQAEQYRPNQPPSSQEDLAMHNKIQKLIISELMDTQPTSLLADTSIYQAVILLAKNNVRSAPVVDTDKQLLGFISEQDLMRSLWSEEFSSQLPTTVKDIMQTKMLTVAPTEKVVQLLEFMVVDKKKLFPVTDSGMYISGNYQSYEARLRDAAAVVPSAYPVVENGRLCGIIRREALMQMLANLYRPKHQETSRTAEQQSVA